MKPQVVSKLQEMNQAFYQVVAESFAETRTHPWEGWLELLPSLEHISTLKKPTVLDLGCGNGRFANFLFEHFPSTQWQYDGIDNNPKLLALAQKELSNHQEGTIFLEKEDILSQNFLSRGKTSPKTYSLITAFGVLHHIPGKALRQKFLQFIANSLEPDGVAIVSAWQFLENISLMQRTVQPASVGIDPLDLEKNDYFLTWERSVSAVRYCHFVDLEELSSLVEKSGLHTISTFFADGKNKKSNLYTVLKKGKANSFALPSA